MNSHHLSRRHFLGTSALGGLAAVSPALAQTKSGSTPSAGRRNEPLAQDYTIATHVPGPGHFVHDPAMTILPNGKLVVASPIWRRPPSTTDTNKVVAFTVSDDHGRTWKKVAEKPWAEAALFVHEGALYIFTQLETWKGVWVAVSRDEAKTWSEPVEVIKGAEDRRHWNLQAAMVVKNGWLYWANGRAYQDMGAVACDLGKGLLNPAAWIASDVVEMPIPDAVVSGKFSDGATMRCLEGNVVDVHGRMLVIARAVINRYGTANMGAVFDLNRDGGKLNLTFRQLYPVPGGQCKLFILYDDPSRMFWLASNLPTNSQDLIRAAEQFPNAYTGGRRSVREDRRNLMLWYSLDALNWFPAGCIAKAEKLTQSFMYPSMVVDGDDLGVLSRTARESGDYHDADLATFHRVRNFRSLAMDISPKF